MALQWVLMGSVAILEAVILVFLSLPLPQALRKRTVWVVENSLQPMLAVVPFAIFQLTGKYLTRPLLWRNEFLSSDCLGIPKIGL